MYRHTCLVHREYWFKGPTEHLVPPYPHPQPLPQSSYLIGIHIQLRLVGEQEHKDEHIDDAWGLLGG